MAKALMRKAEYERNKDHLSSDMFGEDVAELFTLMEEGHERVEGDLKEADLLALWKSKNGMFTKSNLDAFRETIYDIMNAKDISPEVFDHSIQRLWRRKFGTRLANYALQISEGDDDALERIRAMLDGEPDDWGDDDMGEGIDLRLSSLLAGRREGGAFKINIASIAEHLPGMGRRQFGIIFATPNTGKTGFGISLIFGPKGWIEQGHKVLYLGNEEEAGRTALRAYQAYFGLTEAEVILREAELQDEFMEAAGKQARFYDIHGKTLTDISRVLKRVKPDIVIIDQLDKVHIKGNYDSGHERIRELYLQTREVAKTHNCLILGVSQASIDAKGRTQLTSDMMEGSKIGKAAEADIIFGIGMTDLESPARYVTISKNKLTGWHGTIITQIEGEISRYVA